MGAALGCKVREGSEGMLVRAAEHTSQEAASSEAGPWTHLQAVWALAGGGRPVRAECKLWL